MRDGTQDVEGAALRLPALELAHRREQAADGLELDNGEAVEADVVVNAAGVWVDDIREQDEGDQQHLPQQRSGYSYPNYPGYE